MTVKFPLGGIYKTRGVMDSIPEDEMYIALERHSHGDWGDLCPEDVRENELSLEKGFRLFSAYTSKTGKRFWIITEADRSVTTILLPEEY